jgi:hypothetical protein
MICTAGLLRAWQVNASWRLSRQQLLEGASTALVEGGHLRSAGDVALPVLHCLQLHIQRKAEGLLLHALQLLQVPVALSVDSRCGMTISAVFC